MRALQSALASFHSFSQSTEGRDTFAAIGKAVGEIIKILAELPKYFDPITGAAKLFAAVKIAGLFGGLAGKVPLVVSALRTFSAELTLIGPRAQAATNSQTVFGRTLAQSVTTLSSFRQSLLASTSQSALARAGVVGLAGAVGGLQATLVVTAGAFRALRAAFGSAIGIALTAVTYPVGTWLGDQPHTFLLQNDGTAISSVSCSPQAMPASKSWTASHQKKTGSASSLVKAYFKSGQLRTPRPALCIQKLKERATTSRQFGTRFMYISGCWA